MLCALAPLILPAGGPVLGQASPQVMGVVVGRTASELVWRPEVAGSRRDGWLVGGYADVRLPVGPFRARVETTFTQRGGLVAGDVEGDPVDGEVRIDYLSSFLQLKLAGALGPLHAFVAFGPGVDYYLQRREDPLLRQVLTDEHAAALNAAASVGAGGGLADGWTGEVELRWVEGLGPALSGSFVEARNRSLEVLVRVARTR